MVLLGLLLALPAAECQPVVLQNVDRYRVMEACNESVRVVLSHRGETYSPAYIQGIAGTAFKIAGPCPCAPTCGDAMPPDRLLRLLGYDIQCVSLAREGLDLQVEGAKLVERVKAEIRAGRPVILWHAFTNAEWDVVAGYDDEKGVFLGRGSYVGLDAYAMADQKRTTTCGGICPPLGAIFVGERTSAYDARSVEIAALRYAVRHAHSGKFPTSADAEAGLVSWEFREGMSCYEWWAHRFRAEPDHVPDAGDRYALGVYRSTHRAAGEFMLELAAKYPERARCFTRAAGRFAHEADALDELHGAVMGGWEGWRQPDPQKACRAAALLDRAARYYAQGIRDIKAGLEVLAPE